LTGRGAGYEVGVPDSPLHTYLNDHLAGSAFAIDLLDKMCSANEGTEFGAVVEQLQADIKADRAALEQVMATLGVSPGAVRQAAGWVAEKVSRVKFDDLVTGSENLSRLMETEALSLGIEGKQAGWRALKQLHTSEELGVSLDDLIERAADQRSRLEPFRLDAAARAFN
jgi:hypothetical protein